MSKTKALSEIYLKINNLAPYKDEDGKFFEDKLDIKKDAMEIANRISKQLFNTVSIEKIKDAEGVIKDVDLYSLQTSNGGVRYCIIHNDFHVYSDNLGDIKYYFKFGDELEPNKELTDSVSISTDADGKPKY